MIHRLAFSRPIIVGFAALTLLCSLPLIAADDPATTLQLPITDAGKLLNNLQAIGQNGSMPDITEILNQANEHSAPSPYSSLLFVFMLATFIGLGVILRVSRLLHTPLMSLTNAISAIAVVGSIMVTGNSYYPTGIRILGAIALFASMTNIVSGFLITDRMLKMFKSPGQGGPR